MDLKAQSAANDAVYEDIEPFFEWQRDEDSDILTVMLPGFRRDELKVQVTSAPVLKVSAQRLIRGNRWRRVYKEFSIPSDCDTNDLTATFEAGTLKIKFPKLVTPTAKSPEREEVDDKKAEDQAKAKRSDDQVSDNTQKVKEPASDDFTKEKGKTNNGVNGKKAVQEDQEKAKSTDEVTGKTPSPPEKQKEKEPASDDFAKEKGKTAAAVAEAHDEKQRTENVAMTRLKTRLLDFTLSLRPPADREDYKEALAGLVERLKKTKKLMNLMLVALLVVVLVLYVKNAFKSFLGGSKEQEL